MEGGLWTEALGIAKSGSMRCFVLKASKSRFDSRTQELHHPTCSHFSQLCALSPKLCDPSVWELVPLELDEALKRNLRPGPSL